MTAFICCSESVQSFLPGNKHERRRVNQFLLCYLVCLLVFYGKIGEVTYDGRIYHLNNGQLLTSLQQKSPMPPPLKVVFLLVEVSLTGNMQQILLRGITLFGYAHS